MIDGVCATDPYIEILRHWLDFESDQFVHWIRTVGVGKSEVDPEIRTGG